MPTPAAYSGATENCTQERRSPQTRRPPSLLAQGATPAGAGTTCASPSVAQAPRDHPRRHGEHSSTVSRASAMLGPSPQARGPRHRRRSRIGRAAGHPRTCVDHRTSSRRRSRTRGPPPHARGPRVDVRPDPHADGTTPRPGTPASRSRDHPRTCGDHGIKAVWDKVAGGPPPHARGPHAADPAGSSWRGTTPARAGTTMSSPRTTSPTGDHPRTRGDHRRLRRRSGGWRGPPPHARGPLRIGGGARRSRGTTPARAGTTSPSALSRSARRTTPARAGTTVRELGFCWWVMECSLLAREGAFRGKLVGGGEASGVTEAASFGGLAPALRRWCRRVHGE